MEQNNQTPPVPPTNVSPDNYNPLMDSVTPKPYATLNVSADPNSLSQRIPEPTFSAQNIGRENPYEMLGNDGGQGGQKGGGNRGGAAPQPTFNPAMNSLPDEDKQEGAKQLSKMIIDGYEVATGFANNLMMIKPAKLRKLEAAGEIDLDVQVPFGGGTITPMEFVGEFNEANKDALTVSKEFKREVTPVLTRVLAKHGAGITDEQMLVYLFGKDIAMKGALIVQARSIANDFIDSLRELKGNGGRTVVTPPPTPTPRPAGPTVTPPPPTPTNWTTEDAGIQDVNREDFNFATNEVAMASTVQQMQVPYSDGKERLMKQRKRERELGIDGSNSEASAPAGKLSYHEALKKRKTGKQGRKKSAADYMKKSEAEIANEIQLRPTSESRSDANEVQFPEEKSHHNKGTDTLDIIEGID